MNLIVEEWRMDDPYYVITIDEDYTLNDPWFEKSFLDVDAWCTETFGLIDPWGGEPVTGWKRMRNKYVFTEKRMADWFVVRWS